MTNPTEKIKEIEKKIEELRDEEIVKDEVLNISSLAYLFISLKGSLKVYKEWEESLKEEPLWTEVIKRAKSYAIKEREAEILEIIDNMSFSSDKQENIDAHNELIEKIKGEKGKLPYKTYTDPKLETNGDKTKGEKRK